MNLHSGVNINITCIRVVEIKNYFSNSEDVNQKRYYKKNDYTQILEAMYFFDYLF